MTEMNLKALNQFMAQPEPPTADWSALKPFNIHDLLIFLGSGSTLVLDPDKVLVVRDGKALPLSMVFSEAERIMREMSERSDT